MAGLYIHVPFCKRRCVYCDFYSTTYGDEMRRAYVEALCRELTARRDYLEEMPLESIYFGGGTPSQLHPSELERIFECINNNFGLKNGAEITLEANPDDMTPSYVKALRRLPVNRLSMGVQTFDDRLLQSLGRRHDAAQALKAVELCREEGFSNLSIDLMFGLPGQTLLQWASDLLKAFSLEITHLSAYSLIYEEHTVLWNKREKGEVKEADENLSLAMFELLMDKAAEAGFEHYEISNFARPGKQAVHNTAYWTGKHYLGCGPAAHSYNGDSRRWNTGDVRAYVSASGDVPHEVERLDMKTRYNEAVMTRLRTSRGIDLDAMARTYGNDEMDYLLHMACSALQRGLLVRTVQKEEMLGFLRLTRKGLFVSDDVMSDLLDVD